jgi:hypothetical protein
MRILVCVYSLLVEVQNKLTKETEMEWTEPTRPNQECHYDHIECQTPLGLARIEWKGWKERDSPCVYLNGEYLDSAFDIAEAKEMIEHHLIKKRDDLVHFLIGEIQ